MGAIGSLVLLDPISGRLYRVPPESYRQGVVVAGSALGNEQLERFVEVSQDEELLLPGENVRPHLVADRDVHEILRAHDVGGLRAVGAEPGTARVLPLSGNLVDPSWLSICVGGQCGSRCVFCYTEWIRREPALTSRVVRETIDVAESIGTVRLIVFSGGEPTVRRDLPELLRYAASRGMDEIGLQTNGHRLADASYLATLREAGLSQVLLSLHGARRETHDAVTGVAGSFGLARSALAELATCGIDTTVNFVVCVANLSETAELVTLVDDVYPRASVRFSFPIVEGAAFANVEELLVTLPEFVAAVTSARAGRPHGGPQIEVANVPPCISHKLGVAPMYLRSQRRELLQASPFYDSPHRRGEVLTKLDACEGCAYDTDCDGIQLAYLARFRDGHRHIRRVAAVESSAAH
jgi:MoaA/NifB/PqqE/SkfB family radical SAM enzyme